MSDDDDAALAVATNAPVPFDWDGRTWQLGGLRLADRAELRRRVADYILAEYGQARALLAERDAPRDHFDILLDELRLARRHPLQSDFATEFEPFAYAVWLRLRPHHPGLELATVREMLEAPGMYDRLTNLCRKADTGRDVLDRYVRMLVAWRVVRGSDDLTDEARWQAFDAMMIEHADDEDLDGIDGVLSGNPPSPSPTERPTGAQS